MRKKKVNFTIEPETVEILNELVKETQFAKGVLVDKALSYLKRAIDNKEYYDALYSRRD